MTGLRVTDFDFDLPEELIAQQPPAERGQSRMLTLDRTSGALRDTQFSEFPSLLKSGDLLVLNDSRVIPARLYAQRLGNSSNPVQSSSTEAKPPQNPIPTANPPQSMGAPGLDFETGDTTTLNQRTSQQLPTGRIEVLLTEPVPNPENENRWRALVRPGRKVAIGERLIFPAPTGTIELEAEVIDRGEFGERLLCFAPTEDFFGILDRIGHMPLPPYIRRGDESADRERYQTIFSRDPGSVAAPTAGLHFTPEILDALTAKGVEIARVTLHVGLGTFAPLRVETVDEVRLHRERYSISAQTADAINRATAEGRRIVAVGTTTVRTLESAAQKQMGRPLQTHSGETEIFISPGFQFRLVSALLTNFHLPQSSLLMLVSAFAGREHVLAAYAHAVQQKYRFFSYGDCMFLS